MRKWLLVVVLSLLSVAMGGCGAGIAPVSEGRTLTIISGSENETLEPLIQEWAKKNNAQIEMTFLGSVDISRMLQTGAIAYDAVWPANALWLAFGDEQNIVQHEQSIMRSPVVFAVKRSTANRLGWINAEVTMQDILVAAQSGDVRFMMTSATQSNSGSSFYFAALTAFAAQGDVIAAESLADPQVQTLISNFLGTVDRSSGSSGWLKDLFLRTYDLYDGMVNYESVIIETNLALEQQGREALYAIYPTDGLAIADSPLGFVRHGNDEKEATFLELQQYLLGTEAQASLLASGRRTGVVGLQVDNANLSVFRPEWGIDLNRVIQPIRFPNAGVIDDALRLYQTTFRRPSCTVLAVDRSGSMQGGGEQAANAGLRTVLNQSIAEQYLIQAHEDDVTTLVFFNDEVLNDDFSDWTVEGNDSGALSQLLTRAERVSSRGGTNIFDTAKLAHSYLTQNRTDKCLPSVILMTDGRDNAGDYNGLMNYLSDSENDIPIFVITFGDAMDDEVKPIAEFTYGRVFDGRKDLIAAFRNARGYN